MLGNCIADKKVIINFYFLNFKILISSANGHVVFRPKKQKNLTLLRCHLVVPNAKGFGILS